MTWRSRSGGLDRSTRLRALLHISDVHFGPKHLDDRAAAVLALVRDRRPDYVVISGDLTQRAKPHQFAAAKRFVETIPCPTIAVPGNHDVPLYRFWERAFSPFGAWRRHFSAELEPHVVDDEVCIVGVNTAFNRTLTGGRITARAAPARARVVRGGAALGVSHRGRASQPGAPARARGRSRSARGLGTRAQRAALLRSRHGAERTRAPVVRGAHRRRRRGGGRRHRLLRHHHLEPRPRHRAGRLDLSLDRDRSDLPRACRFFRFDPDSLGLPADRRAELPAAGGLGAGRDRRRRRDASERSHPLRRSAAPAARQRARGGGAHDRARAAGLDRALVPRRRRRRGALARRLRALPRAHDVQGVGRLRTGRGRQVDAAPRRQQQRVHRPRLDRLLLPVRLRLLGAGARHRVGPHARTAARSERGGPRAPRDPRRARHVRERSVGRARAPRPGAALRRPSLRARRAGDARRAGGDRRRRSCERSSATTTVPPTPCW